MTGGATPADAERVFRRQVEAFNARDLAAYLAVYGPDAVVMCAPQ